MGSDCVRAAWSSDAEVTSASSVGGTGMPRIWSKPSSWAMRDWSEEEDDDEEDGDAEDSVGSEAPVSRTRCDSSCREFANSEWGREIRIRMAHFHY